MCHEKRKKLCPKPKWEKSIYRIKNPKNSNCLPLDFLLKFLECLVIN